MRSVNRVAVAAAVLVLCGLGTLAVRAEESPSPWQTNFEAAKAAAKTDGKKLFVLFTGSDWCVFCKMLKEEVLDKDAFKTEAPKTFVLVELDFPRSFELPKELQEQNEKLQEHYKIGGFPTVLLMDPEGQPIAQTGYRRGGAEDYVSHLAELVKLSDEIVAMKGRIESVEGLDRAKLLDEIVIAAEKLGVGSEDAARFGPEIIALDPENTAGLKVKYTLRGLLADAGNLNDQGKRAEALGVLEKAAALEGLSGEQRQEVYFRQGECNFYLRDFAAVVAALNKAVEAAPESDQVAQFKQMIERFTPMAEVQAALAKLKTEVEKAEGLERAKILDQMVEAQSKLNQGRPSEDVEKWSSEIIALDPENKAGLKAKYEFNAIRQEAVAHLRARDFDKVQAALDKALAIPGLTDEQKSGVETLQKALNSMKPAPQPPAESKSE